MRETRTFVRSAAAALLAWAALGGMGGYAGAADFHAPAAFRVTPDVVNRDVPAFTATVAGIGNAFLNFSYEPKTFRTRVWAAADADDEVPVHPEDITGYDTYREGFFDGAEVRVYRPVNGVMELVRRDVVPAGGSKMSGWLDAVGGGGELIPPTATGARWKFDDWNRPGAPYYFAAVAVDKTGRASAASHAVEIVKPKENGAGAAKTDLVKVNFGKPAAGAAAVAAPGGFTAALDPATGVVTFAWDKADSPDLAGFRVVRSDYAPSAHKGYGLKLAGRARADKEKIKAGDWVVLSKEIRDFSRNRDLSNRVWGAFVAESLLPAGVGFQNGEDPGRAWALAPHEKGSPVTDGGATCLRVTLKAGATFSAQAYNHSGTGQTWYDVLDPGREYVVEFWARQEGMETPKMTFRVGGPFAQSVGPVEFTLTKEWKKHTAAFRVPELLGGAGVVGSMGVEAAGPGTLWVDNVRVYGKDAPFLDYTKAEYDILKRSGMSMLRSHSFIKTGTSTYTMEQFTNPPGVISGVYKENTLPQFLAATKRAGMNPWVQCEMHMSPEEWAGLVEYLAAPYDPRVDTPQSKPWAAKRYAQGQARPWADEFSAINFEVSNETWNWLFAPWVFEGMTDGATRKQYERGEVYGMFNEHVISCLAKSPYWTSSGLDKKTKFVLGGWVADRNRYGNMAALHSPRATYNTIAAYNGGWDEGEGPTTGDKDSLWRTLLQVAHIGTDRSVELLQDRDKMRAEGKATFELGTYEAGPGYALSGLNGQAQMTPDEVLAQERTMKSLAAGTATLDCFLDKAYYGHKLQNFFTFHVGGTHWVSHAPWYKGAVASPPWMMMELFNTQGTGSFLKTEAMSTPTADAPKWNGRPEKKDIPLVACYATRSGSRVNVFVLSRKVANYPDTADAGFTPVTLRLPFSAAAKVTVYKMAGDPAAHNLDGEVVKVTSAAVPADAFKQEFVLDAARGADARGLPPGATFLYVFEGTNVPAGKDVSPVPAAVTAKNAR